MESAVADLIITLARQSARQYAADRDEPPYADDLISRAIFAEYHRLRAEQRARDVEALTE